MLALMCAHAKFKLMNKCSLNCRGSQCKNLYPSQVHALDPDKPYVLDLRKGLSVPYYCTEMRLSRTFTHSVHIHRVVSFHCVAITFCTKLPLNVLALVINGVVGNSVDINDV